MNHIRKLWDKYATEMMPQDAPLIQIIETRRAFYAGAASLFGELVTKTRDEKITEDQGKDFITEINSEISQFGQDLIDGRV